MAVKATPEKLEFKEPAPSPEPEDQADAHNPPDAKVQFEDFTYVRFPDGTIRAVPNATIMQAGQNGGITNLEGPPPGRDESEVYVHLADGSVERMKAYDVPPAAGTNYPNGFHIRDGNSYQVIAVYPVETPHND